MVSSSCSFLNANQCFTLVSQKISILSTFLSLRINSWYTFPEESCVVYGRGSIPFVSWTNRCCLLGTEFLESYLLLRSSSSSSSSFLILQQLFAMHCGILEKKAVVRHLMIILVDILSDRVSIFSGYYQVVFRSKKVYSWIAWLSVALVSVFTLGKSHGWKEIRTLSAGLAFPNSLSPPYQAWNRFWQILKQDKKEGGGSCSTSTAWSTPSWRGSPTTGGLCPLQGRARLLWRRRASSQRRSNN